MQRRFGAAGPRGAEGRWLGTSVPEDTGRSADRVARRKIDKFAVRRAELATAALQTLAQLGIARTTLREIAQNSAYSHGVLHYYFSDKLELITCCVRQFKAECVARYDSVIATEASPAQFKRSFAALMAATLRDDALMHRLWYDLRNYSQFDDRYRADVSDIDESLERMIWRVVSKYAELAQTQILLHSGATYAVFDGLFRRALNAYMAGDASAPAALKRDAPRLLELVSPAPAWQRLS